MEKWFQSPAKKPRFLISFLHHNVRRYQTIIFPPLTIRIDYNKPVYSNKSHGWDELYIKMIEMYDKTLAYPLKLIL